MAQSDSARYPVIVIPPLLDQELTTLKPTMILRDYDNLPPFTLILDWECPACSEGRQYKPHDGGAEPDEHRVDHSRAISQQFMELRYTDQPRYLIWPSMAASEEHKDLFSRSTELLASRCEYAAQWQPGSGQQAYLKVVPGPIMNPVQDLERFEVPVFFIRPSRTVSDRIDAKIVFFEPEELPSLCILSHLPLDECFTLHHVEDGHAHLMQSGVDSKEIPEFPQGSWDSQDAQAKALLAPNPALDNSMQLFIAGVPDPSLRPLAVHAFRVLRFYKINYVYTTLLRSYLQNEKIWKTDIWKVPRYRDSYPLCTAQWWDPEETIDFLDGPVGGQRTELLHLEHLNPKELLKIRFNEYAFMHYGNLDMSATSTQIRLIEGEISEEHEEPTNWRFVHTELTAEDCPPFYYINDFVSDYLDGPSQCEIVRLNGKETAIPVPVMGIIKELAKETERPSEGVAKVYFFLRHLCINNASCEERKHYAPLYPQIRNQAKSSMYSMRAGSYSSLLKMDQLSSFYSPLEKDQHNIRLFRLKDCDTQSPDAPVELEVLITDIESAPKFIAISHDWETAGSLGTIMMEGREIMVPKELESALIQLRRVSEGSYVWVDMLSINQLDLDERASQTSLLPHIYGSADYVFVWLGEIKADFVRILNALSRIQIPRMSTELPGLSIEIIRILLEIDSAIEGLRGFLQAQWWKKIWMIQPFVLAQSLELYTETAMVEWEVFSKAIKVLHVYVYQTPPSSEIRQTAAFQLLSPLVQNVYDISMLREWHRHDDQPSPAIGRAKDYLLYCLWLLHPREHSDARDIMYTACMLAQRNAPILHLTYKKTIREVYHDAAIAIITYYKDLKLLSHTLFSRRRHESRKADSDVPIEPLYYWPSWVPDWRLRPWGLGSTTFNLEDFVVSPQLAFNACDGLKAHIEFSDNSKILHVVGVQVGRIKKVFRTKDPRNSVDQVRLQQELDTDWETLRLTPPGHQREYIAGGPWPVAWIRTCEIMDRESFSGMVGRRILCLPENSLEDNLRRLGLYGHGHPELVTDEIGTYRYGSPEPSSWDGINAILKPQRLTNAAGEPIIEERFHLISLDSGHVGFGGYAVQEGDLVCILKGGSYPYVLRQRRDGLYHLVSDSYVHGVMNGEFVRSNADAGAKWQDFGIVRVIFWENHKREHALPFRRGNDESSGDNFGEAWVMRNNGSDMHTNAVEQNQAGRGSTVHVDVEGVSQL
ncbi:hypothetical protein CNMCM8927_008748 [Aspergillus lentulus]|uniref:Heterokaryon incompatibility domain-containing protein n=1 Tax=Aspergillus lentulus TaxID=293939 RepID=A0AAN6BT77_ASPLE|nr:hypothetical protein CNMCM8927_008748 [Aspergillus lentulus]